MGKKVSVKYKGRKLQVHFTVALKIFGYKACLYLKKIKRAMWRIGKYSVLSCLTIFLWSIFLIITYVVGVRLNYYCNSFLRYIWDSRIAIFTSVILVWILSVYNGKKTYHAKIIKQHDIYAACLFSFQSIIELFWNEFGIKDSIPRCCLYTNDRVNSVWECFTHIKRNSFDGITCNTEKFDWQWAIHSCKVSLENVKIATLNDELVGIHRDTLMDQMVEIQDIIPKIECHKAIEANELLKNSVSMLNSMHMIVADIRRPWRWDSEVDYSILCLLKDEDSSYISAEKEYYWSLFFCDENNTEECVSN